MQEGYGPGTGAKEHLTLKVRKLLN